MLSKLDKVYEDFTNGVVAIAGLGRGSYPPPTYKEGSELREQIHLVLQLCL
jgi:hypothetical protein